MPTMFFFPRLNATAGYVLNNNNQLQKFTDGTKRERNGVKSNTLSGSLQLSWTLFDGLKMFATKERLAELVKLGELTIKNEIVTTVASIVTTYYSIVREKQQLKAIEEQISINAERVKLAEKKLEVGLGGKTELLQSKLDFNSQKAAQITQQTLIETIKERLNLLMGVTPNQAYDVSDSIPFNPSLQLLDIMNAADTTNPTLLLAKKNIDIAALVIRERKADLFPVLSFNSAYNYTKTDNKEVVNPFTPLFNRNNGYNFGFSATIPIFNGGNARRLIKQANLDFQFRKLFYNSQKATIDASIVQAYKTYELQKKALALEENNILLAKENVAIALERFKQGVSTFLELREAQKSLEDGYNRLIAARYTTKIAETELLRLKGDIVK